MPNTMTTLRMEALRGDTTKAGDFSRNPLIPSNISQLVAKHRNPANLLILRALTIRGHHHERNGFGLHGSEFGNRNLPIRKNL